MNVLLMIQSLPEMSLFLAACVLFHHGAQQWCAMMVQRFSFVLKQGGAFTMKSQHIET